MDLAPEMWCSVSNVFIFSITEFKLKSAPTQTLKTENISSKFLFSLKSMLSIKRGLNLITSFRKLFDILQQPDVYGRDSGDKHWGTCVIMHLYNLRRLRVWISPPQGPIFRARRRWKMEALFEASISCGTISLRAVCEKKHH